MDISLYDKVADSYLKLDHRAFHRNDFILLRYAPYMDQDHINHCCTMLRAFLDEDGFKDVQIMALSNDVLLDQLSEDQMLELGWVRKREYRGREFI